MENNNERKGLKGFWDRNKRKIVGVGVATGAVAITLLAVVTKNSESKSQIEEPKEDSYDENDKFDTGRDCLMTFTVEETGEELGKVRCCESFVEDWKSMGLLDTIMEDDYGVTQEGVE